MSPDPNANLSFSQKFRLLFGKARRFYLIHFRPKYVEAKLSGREGECGRSGACCKLGFVCPFFDETTEVGFCIIHKTRPANCRIFPIDERDIADRNLIAPNQPCGFTVQKSDTLSPTGAAFPELKKEHAPAHSDLRS
ncbi:MAG: hypothetical protein NUW37_01720 [Planctomycetes bacterium]|nr:hypothetical protein [Planctomycetota bacterium]